MKRIFLFLLAAAFLSTGALAQDSPEQQAVKKVVDGFNTAVVKKDKEWLKANLHESATSSDPSGATYKKDGIIAAFTSAYDITKASQGTQTITVKDKEASSTSSFSVEGAGNIDGQVIDITNTYGIKFGLKNVDGKWLITSIDITQ